ncbi:MAG TPA: CvpA family protein [Candidatus Kapabacteria bacterium]|nr:CvpA family protein [Candidatus Kapabacteria bacterium]
MLDIIIAVLLVYSLWSGWRRGATRIIGSIIIFASALIIGTLAGSMAGHAVMGGSYLAPIVGFFVVFIAAQIVGSFFIKRLQPKHGIFAGMDKLFGATLSGIRMLLLIGLAAAFFRLFHVPSSAAANRSTLYSASLQTTASMVSQLKPLAVRLSDDVIEKSKPADSH